MEQKERLYYGIRKTKFGFKATEFTKDEFWGQRELPYSYDYGAYVSARLDKDGYLNGSICLFLCNEDEKMVDDKLVFGNWLLDNQIDFGWRSYCIETSYSGYCATFNVLNSLDNENIERYVEVWERATIEHLIEKVFDYMDFLSSFANIQSITLFDSMAYKKLRYYNPDWHCHRADDIRRLKGCVEIRDKFNEEVPSFIEKNKSILSERCIQLLNDRLEMINSYVEELKGMIEDGKSYSDILCDNRFAKYRLVR